jgi:hypothetical protein
LIIMPVTRLAGSVLVDTALGGVSEETVSHKDRKYDLIYAVVSELNIVAGLKGQFGFIYRHVWAGKWPLGRYWHKCNKTRG